MAPTRGRPQSTLGYDSRLAYSPSTLLHLRLEGGGKALAAPSDRVDRESPGPACWLSACRAPATNRTGGLAPLSMAAP